MRPKGWPRSLMKTFGVGGASPSCSPEAQRIAVNIAKVPDFLRKVIKGAR
jgi:hypothetical protein